MISNAAHSQLALAPSEETTVSGRNEGKIKMCRAGAETRLRVALTLQVLRLRRLRRTGAIGICVRGYILA